MLYFSPSEIAFYDDHIHHHIPDDAKEISAGLHRSLMQAQGSGREISADADGNPIAIDPAPPTDDQWLQMMRAERDARLAACDFTQLQDAPLTAEERLAWGAYRQQLRDLPETITDPADILWPVPPEGPNP